MWGHDGVTMSGGTAPADLTGYWLQVLGASYQFGDAVTLSHFQVENLGLGSV